MPRALSPPASMNPTTTAPVNSNIAAFDPNEQLASVFLSNVTDFKTRLNLRLVSKAFLNADMRGRRGEKSGRSLEVCQTRRGGW